MIYVVGSGPAGIAAAMALVSKNLDVTMLDVGRTLEKERQLVLDDLRRRPSTEWDARQIAELKGEVKSSTRGVSLKKIYGSTFPYRPMKTSDSCSPAVDIKSSEARGGFSNVWGAVLLPFQDQDLKDWPLTLADLEPHYRAVLSWMPVAAVRDSLERDFPLYTDHIQSLNASRQALQILSRLEENQKNLLSEGITFGRARLAVQAEAAGDRPGCVYCGMCLSGCPYDLIYNTSSTLEFLMTHPRFRYHPSVRITHVRENGGRVHLSGVHSSTGQGLNFEGDRVFLACGALPTTQILMRSLPLIGSTVLLKSSQYFILPFLLNQGVRDVSKEALHTLCQVLLEVNDERISPHVINLQLYTYNDLFLDVVRNFGWSMGRILEPFLKTWMGRLSVFQGYLHSLHSPQAGLRLDQFNGNERWTLAPKFNSESKPAVKKLVRKLNRLADNLGGRPLGALLSLGKIGDGSHVGGSFPMGTLSGSTTSDPLGRPAGWERIHAVDSTVLPSIPATTITLTVMANAHRIASLAGAL